MQLQFFGASGTVTGSKSVIKLKQCCYMIDAGLFLGEQWAADKNSIPLPPEILNSLKAVFITHAHLDHCGYLPYLVNQGYSGPIFMTEATRELVRIVLDDAFSIVSDEFASKKIAKLPYNADDLQKVFSMIVTKKEGVDYDHDSLFFKFISAGHILGACSLLINWNQKRVLFSGDLGRKDDLVHVSSKEHSEQVDIVVIEGTYGGAEHCKGPVNSVISDAIKNIRGNSGVLLIPSFAIARSVIVLKVLNDFFNKHPEFKLKIFVDSPMMIKALRVYQKYADQLKITPEELAEIIGSVKLVEFPKDRKKLTKQKPPYILVSSSGMLSGGRSVEHFERVAIKDFNQVMFVGYQGVGTLGRKVIDGEKSFVADGKLREIKAKITQLLQLSAHADQSELITYLKTMTPQRVFINHAEPESAELFAKRISSELELEVDIAEQDKRYELE